MAIESFSRHLTWEDILGLSEITGAQPHFIFVWQFFIINIVQRAKCVWHLFVVE